MEHTCMSAIYYNQGSDIKAKQCKTIITFDTIPESKILDAGNVLILSNLQKPWTIACKDISRVFEIEYSTYRILNRSELCECLLTTGNCKVQPHCALLGYPFCNTAAHTEATPTREGI